MEIKSIKTGDVFYYDTYAPHENKTYRHKGRILFPGTESLFYDVWRDGINAWAFVPVSKRLSYYRFPLSELSGLHFDGFEPIDKKSADKLFLNSPEILLNVPKVELKSNRSGDEPIAVNSDTIAFIPMGPKGGELKPILFETATLTRDTLIEKVLGCQNLDFIQTDEIVIHRVGLHGGFPSYCVKTYI